MKTLTPDRQTRYDAHKALEQVLLASLDKADFKGIADPRWLSIAKTHFEIGFMALNRALSEGQP